VVEVKEKKNIKNVKKNKKKVIETFDVFLGNLPFDCTEEDVKSFFETCKSLTEVKLKRGTGFAKFGTE